MSDGPTHDEVTTTSLRREASSFVYEELTTQQKRALTKLLGALGEAVGEVEDDAYRQDADVGLAVGESYPPTDAVTHIDRFRKSRLFFLDGARGSGKTSLYLTLLSMCSRSHRWEPRPVDVTEKQWNEWTKVARSLLWLQPMDMEPLPTGTNLVAAVMARLIEVEERFHAGGRGAGPRTRRNAGLLEGDHELQPGLALRQLAADLAISWDGNLSTRSARVDPDTYATEVRRVETARLPFSRRLWLCLEQIARTIGPPVRGGSGPIFVLPVDDFDLNPTCALELMRLLRMVSVPRLFFVILGDRDLVETVFSLKIAGDFGELTKHAKHESMLSVHGEDVGGISRQVAANAIRKLLPPFQSVRLERLPLTEALAFAPKGKVSGDRKADARDQTKDPTLLRMLSRFDSVPWVRETGSAQDVGVGGDPRGPEAPVSGPASSGGAQWHPLLPVRIASMADFLGLSLHDTRGELRTIYSGAGALTAPPRHLADLWYALRDTAPEDVAASDRKKPESLAEVLARQAVMAIEEDHHLELSARETFRMAVTRDFDDRWELDTSLLRAETRSTPGSSCAAGALAVFRHAHVREWRITPADQPEAKAADRTESMLILLHDVLGGHGGDASLFGAVLTPDPYALDWAYVDWSHGTREPVRVTWPVPDGLTFWELDVLRAYWEAERVRGAATPDSDEKVLRAAYVWITAITSILARRFGLAPWLGLGCLAPYEPASGPPARSEGGPKEPGTSDLPWLKEGAWKELGTTVAALMLTRPGSDGRVRPVGSREQSWLVALACLMAPESGIPTSQQSLFGPFCNALRSGWRAPDVQQAIRRRRAQRFAPFLRGRAYGLFRALSFTWEKGVPAELTRLAEGIRTQSSSTTSVDSSTDLEDGVDLEPVLAAIDDPNWRLALEEGLPAADAGRKGGEFRSALGELLDALRSARLDPPTVLSIALAAIDHPVNRMHAGRLQPLRSEIGIIEKELTAPVPDR